MAKIVFNFTKMHLDYELRALSQVTASMEEHLAIAVDLESGATFDRIRAEWDDDEAVTQMANDEIVDLRDVVFPRLFRGSHVVVLAATLEDCVKELFSFAKRAKKSDVSFKPKKHEGFVDRCVRVFGDRLGYDLWDSQTIQDLKLLMHARNSFAHSAGRLDSAAREALSAAMEGEDASLLDRDGYLVPTSDYVEHALGLVVRSINELSEQVMPGASGISLSSGETTE